MPADSAHTQSDFFCKLLAQWLIYIEYTLHQSREMLRRRYRTAIIPFIIAVVILIARFPIMIWMSNLIVNNVPLVPYIIGKCIMLLSYAVLFFYIIASYVVLIKERKRTRIPAYIHFMPSMICILIGFVADIMTGFSILPLSFAIGLAITDYSMYKRLNDIDPVTGFLTENISHP